MEDMNRFQFAVFVGVIVVSLILISMGQRTLRDRVDKLETQVRVFGNIVRTTFIKTKDDVLIIRYEPNGLVVRVNNLLVYPKEAK